MVLLLSLSLNAFSEEMDNEGIMPKLDIEASGSFDVYSKYIWRGFALETDPVLQPGVSLAGYGLTFSFWSSWDFDNNDSLDGDEIDYVIDYTDEFEYFSVSVGHTYYEFPGTDTFSREFYAGLGLYSILFSPRLTYYYDYGDHEQGGADGQYITLEVFRSIILVKELGISLDLSGKVAYNKKLFINGEGGDGLASTELTIPLAKGLTFSLSANYAMPYGDLDDSGDGNQKERFYYGFGLSYEFP